MNDALLIQLKPKKIFALINFVILHKTIQNYNTFLMPDANFFDFLFSEQLLVFFQ